MNYKYLSEFSEIYCRLMRLELLMKEKLVNSLLNYYGEDIINQFNKFFYNKNRLKRYENKTGNTIIAIIKNTQILKNSVKFKKLINLMYLSDILFLILCCEQFRKNDVIEKFYSNKPQKYGLLMKKRQVLLDLRNTIAHYNIKDFEQNKKHYFEILELFEFHIL